MTILTVKRLAADIFGVGENRIRISSENIGELKSAMTRADVKSYIEKGLIKKIPVQGRASSTKRFKRGESHRRGRRLDPKSVWMEKIRSQRKLLVQLVKEAVLKNEHKWAIYRKIKSGLFRNKNAMILYLKDNSFISKNYGPVGSGQKARNKKTEEGKKVEKGENQ